MYLAALPMYSHHALEKAYAIWLNEFVRRLNLSTKEVKCLKQVGDLLQLWLNPQLLLSQTCGYPLISMLADKVQVVGAFAYAAKGCHGADYSSILIAAREDSRHSIEEFRMSHLAINDWHSQSGFNALRLYLRDRGLLQQGGFFNKVSVTGSHRQSVENVAQGMVDFAAIDCVTFALLQKYESTLTNAVKIIGYTEHYPGLPLITSKNTSQALLNQMRQVISDMIMDEQLASINEALLFKDFAVISHQVYQQKIQLAPAEIAQL